MTGEGEAGCRAAWEAIEQGGDQDLLGFGTVADGRWLLARLRSDEAMDRLAPEHSPDWRSLGVSILHVLVLDSLLKPLGHRLLPLRPPAPRGPRRRRRPRMRPGLPRPARADGARRVDRLGPRNDAAQEHLFLPQAAHRPGAQPACAGWSL